MNSQIATPSLWDLGPDPKATENKDSYLAPKGADAYREQILKRSLSPHIHSWGLDQALSKENLNGSFPFLSWFVAIHKLWIISSDIPLWRRSRVPTVPVPVLCLWA